MYRRKGRILAGLLALILVCTSSGVSVLADEGTDQGYTAGLCEHHPEHTDDCGYDAASGTPCAYECDICGDNVSEESSEEDSPARDENENMQDDAAPVDDDSDSVQDAEQNDSAEVADTKEIVEWTWVDEDGVLQQNGNVWGLGVPGASEDNPLTQDALLEMLPKQIDAVLAGGREAAVDLTWDLSAIPEEGVWSGDYTVTADVDVTYSLGVDVAPLSVEVEVGGGETYTELPTGSIANAPFSNHLVNGVSPNGTTINLFDYWLTDRTAADNEDPWPPGDEVDPTLQNEGINQNHALVFSAKQKADAPRNEPYFSAWNAWTGSAVPYSGIVQDKLVDGYPVLNLTQDQVNGAQNPYYPFGYTLTGRNPKESLAYLFNSQSFEGKQAYMDVQGLLQVDQNGYYYYDSESNYAVFYEEDNTFALYDKEGVTSGGAAGNKGQFFPFNSASDVFNDNYVDNGIVSTNPVLNHYFGLTMSTRFIQQNGGRVSDEPDAAPVTYTFSGDDDVWVFIDDKLVADLGGIHNAASLNIDFSTGIISINDVPQSQTLGDVLGHSSTDTLPDNTYHTLDFFYLERGNTDSNMSLHYNLVTIPESSVIKVDQTGDPVNGAEFALYAANNTDTPIATGTTDANGEFVFIDENDFPLTIQQLSEKYGNEENGNATDLILRETVVPDGYRSNGDLELRFYETVDDEVLLLSNNQWGVGAYAMSKVTTTAPNTIVEADNGGEQVDLRPEDNPLMFAVVFQKQTDRQWHPVYGDPLKGWHVTDGSGWADIREAARANPYIFQLASSGAYQVNIDNLPGDITKYYHICGNEDEAEYTIAYYYTTASTINDVNGNNTWRIEPEAENEANQFDRVFSVNLYVPNIKNRLFIQKVDDAGKPINGVEFTLYNSSQVTVSEDGTVTPINIDDYYDRRRTENITQTITLDGGGVFPTSEKGMLERGEYYLFETSGLNGYVKNDTAIHIIVDNTGVYADAGNADDGVSVLKGVGSIVKSMVQFATDDNVDTTLNTIKAGLQTVDLNEYNENGSFTWNDNIAWDSPEADILHLQYANQYSVLDYGLTGATEPGTVDTLTLETDTGWSRLSIKQCYQHDESVDVNLKENLIDRDITKLFSGTTVVRVENQRSNTLTISKEVVDESNTVSETQEFTFTLTGTNADSNALSGSYSAERTNADGTTRPETVAFDGAAGTAKITLKVGESITLTGLPTGAVITVTEAEVDGVTYDTTYTVNGGEAQIGKATGELKITSDGSVNVAFTNTYVPTADFAFQKTDAQDTGLGGAYFGLYKLECSASGTHNHENDLLTVDQNGALTGNYAEDDSCWKRLDAGGVISAEHTGLVSFENLEISAEYRLIEYKAPGGYVLPDGQWKLKYNNDKKAFGIIGAVNEAGTPAFEEGENGNSFIEGSQVYYRVRNYQPGELPFSGNTGIRMFLLIGGALMLFGAAGGTWYYIHHRKPAAVYGRRRRRRR